MAQQQDYIIRLIEQLGALIRQALGRSRSYEREKRPELAGEAIGLALAMDPAVAADLTPASLAALLMLGDVDSRVMALLQQALEVDATAMEEQGDPTTAMLRRDQCAAIRSLLESREEAGSGGAPGAADVSYTA